MATPTMPTRPLTRRVRPKWTVMRYTVPSVKEQRYFELNVPYGAGILGFHEDKTITSRTEAKYEHVVSFICDPSEPHERRMFRVASYGEDLGDLLDKNYVFVGTIPSVSGYVFHLFEVFR